jgi:hypothetical protein
MWIEVIRSKSDAFKLFKKIKAMAEAEAQRGLRALRSDRGGEFNSGEFKLYCEEFGIKHFTVEMARCLLKGMDVPVEF